MLVLWDFQRVTRTSNSTYVRSGISSTTYYPWFYLHHPQIQSEEIIAICTANQWENMKKLMDSELMWLLGTVTCQDEQASICQYLLFLNAFLLKIINNNPVDTRGACTLPHFGRSTYPVFIGPLLRSLISNVLTNRNFSDRQCSWQGNTLYTNLMIFIISFHLHSLSSYPKFPCLSCSLQPMSSA